MVDQGLQIEVFRDRVVVKARDVAAGAWLKQITEPLSARIRRRENDLVAERHRLIMST
ncbi:hypothetical protein [Streptomyces sp. NPDC001930]|uniref:hypothetical protein n=1 Tax=Streptomyces sp. NPDC001930 TaxID=3364625 RepID=UPI003674400B